MSSSVGKRGRAAGDDGDDGDDGNDGKGAPQHVVEMLAKLQAENEALKKQAKAAEELAKQQGKAAAAAAAEVAKSKAAAAKSKAEAVGAKTAEAAAKAAEAAAKAAAAKAKKAEAAAKAAEAATKADAAKMSRVAEEQATCVVCADIIEVPVTTPCGHSFCKSCLVTSADVKNECPLCRKALFTAPPAFSAASFEFRTAYGAGCAALSSSVLIQASADAARGRETLSAAVRSPTYAERALRVLPWLTAGPLPDRLRTMLSAIKVEDVNAKDSCDRSLLWWLARWGLATYDGILNKGANVDAADNYLRMTPLILAAKVPTRPECVKALLDKKADVHAKDASGNAALNYISGFDSAVEADKIGAHKILLTLAEADCFKGVAPPPPWAERLAFATVLKGAGKFN